MPQTHAHNNDRQRVLDATDIVQLIGEHCALKPRGREFITVCPFHDDHNPSMYVVPNKQIYHCFSCGAGGNAIDFVIGYHKIPFRDALRLLADRAGVELTPWRAEQRGGAEDHAVPRDEIAAANRFALDYFRSVLRHPQGGGRARAVVAARDISPEMVEAFHLGAAPDRWDGLLSYAQRKGVREEALLAAGLVKQRPNGPGLYDAFRNRVIFPILDQLERVVAFGARRINDEDDPKYLNSPETALFDKSSTLYALPQANRAIQRERTAIVTEGYTDAIACHQHGVEHVVATLGTALTPKHAAILRRLADTVVLLFDSDDAGARAADRALEVFFDQPIEVKIAVVPDGKDPAEILQQAGGAARFREAVAQAADALDHRFRRLAQRLAPLPETARAKAIEEDLARLVELGMHKLNPIRRRLVVKRLASIIRVSEQAIIDAMPQSRRPARLRAQEPDDAAHPDPIPTTDAAHALGALLAQPELLDSLRDEDEALLAPEAVAPASLRPLAEALFALAGRCEADALFQQALSSLEADEDRRVAVALAQRAQKVTDDRPERMAGHLTECLRHMRRRAAVTQTPADALDSGGERAKHAGPLDEQLEALRRRNQSFGGDPRAFPRAAPAAPP